jgi:cytochrome c-type biogenesis protein CcmE
MGHKVDSCNTDLHKLFYTPSETNSKYKGKYVKVSGIVIHQGKFNNSNNIAVCIYRWNFNGKRYDILGAINEKNKEWTRNIKEGSSVVITGKFIGAVEQKNKNVISLQILVSQLPQIKDK